jgi:hypothetical protein
MFCDLIDPILHGSTSFWMSVRAFEISMVIVFSRKVAQTNAFLYNLSEHVHSSKCNFF